LDCLVVFSDAERQHENEMKRQSDERIQSKIHYLQKQTQRPPTIIKSDQIAQTDHQVDRVVYIDEPIPKAPSAATKAFVRNLNSSSVQQNMLWDSESLDTQRTNSDMFVFVIDYFISIISMFYRDFKSNTARDLHRKHYTNDESNILKKPSVIKQEHRSIGTHSPVINDYTSPLNNERIAQVKIILC